MNCEVAKYTHPTFADSIEFKHIAVHHDQLCRTGRPMKSVDLLGEPPVSSSMGFYHWSSNPCC
jgi:hypothetical protein